MLGLEVVWGGGKNICLFFFFDCFGGGVLDMLPALLFYSLKFKALPSVKMSGFDLFVCLAHPIVLYHMNHVSCLQLITATMPHRQLSFQF